LKGKKILQKAQVIIYAGSLINPALLEGLKAELYDSSGMKLEEIVDVMKKAVSQGKNVVRLHSGDISFYSAISEQIEVLRKEGIPYEVVPGVSSLSAGAAVLGQELTIPEISQTVIITRAGGRTPVPERQSLELLAKHRATMVLFLSASLADRVQEALLKGGYPEETPVAIVVKASWPEQRVIRCRLSELAKVVEEEGIKRSALIFVGDALRASEVSLGKRSHLYGRWQDERRT
ncbi:MAG: precorrin-4 C(11)-methyltransferase, partial [Nitrospirae bacterium]